MKHREGRGALIALFCITVIVPFLGSAQGAPRSDEWLKTLIISVTNEPQTFDPAVNVATLSAYRYYPNVYESLVYYAPDGKLKPMLAEKWEILDNGLRYRFHLVGRARFSDGTSFDANAVKFAFDRYIGIGKGLASAYSYVKSAEVVDNDTVDIVLKQQFAPFLGLMSTWYGAIFVSPAAVRAHEVGGDQAQGWLQNHTAGTGPYALETWVPENRVVFVKNPYYRLGWKPRQIERVVYTTIREPSTMLQALEGGAIDMAEEIQPSLIEPLKNSKNVTVHLGTNHQVYGVVLNLNHSLSPLNNVNVRRALTYAINFDRIVAVWRGTAIVEHGPFPATFKPWYSEKALVKYRQDLAKAGEYLAKAGMTMPINPPLRFTLLWQTGFTTQRDMAQLIAEDWAKLGVQVNITETALPVWREAIWRHTFEVAFYQTGLRYNDPDAWASLYYHSREFRYQGWNPGYRNPRVDQLVELGQTTVGTTARLVYYAELQHIVTDEVVNIPLVDKQHASAFRREVEGIVWNPNYGPHFRAYEIRKNSNVR